MPNVFDTNDIRTTGLTVEGITVLSGNSNATILTVTGESGTNLRVIDDANSDLLWSVSAQTEVVFDVFTDRIDHYKNINVTGNTAITGSLSAASKSFDIPHPSRGGFRLRYGSLEGPEYGVYLRGRTSSSVITLPNYWKDLIDYNTITVQLTPIGKNFHWVEKIENSDIHLECDNEKIDTFFLVIAERKDIPPLEVEYKPL